MFRKNQRHIQPSLLSNIRQLPEKHRERLEQSWAGVFYREVFSRVNEDLFSVLYSDIPSRPNTAVNVLVGLEFLKAGFGWSDEELYDAFLYNLQVRYALGYHEFGEGDFDLRTLYYFRERLHRYMLSQGENLMEKAFKQLTDEQVVSFRLKTGLQRMDATFVSSNIRDWNRLQLLVVVLQRVYRMLSAADQARYAEGFAPYVKEHAGRYTYRLKKEDYLPHLQRIGECMYQWLADLKPAYQEHPTYQMLMRVFAEHYQVAEQKVNEVANQDLSPHCLLSPDDFEASLRARRKGIYRGYTANLTETCDPENPFQLITHLQVAANNVDDPQLLLAALPDLKSRTQLHTLYTDGGFGSYAVDLALQEQQVEHVPTAIRGRQPNPEKLSLANFELQFDPSSQPTHIQCPQGQSVAVEPGSRHKGFVARFAPGVCATCPFSPANRCPAEPGRKNPTRSLYFSNQAAQLVKRRQQVHAARNAKGNPRAAIEATCRALKCRFPKSKLPVRGLFRMTCMLIGSAALNNVRQIYRSLLST